jgi:hypothetical protein
VSTKSKGGPSHYGWGLGHLNGKIYRVAVKRSESPNEEPAS